MSESRWRNIARAIISRVIEETKGQSNKAVREALRKAYPFGERRHHPYKIWLDEIAVQMDSGPAIIIRDTRNAWNQVTEERARR